MKAQCFKGVKTFGPSKLFWVTKLLEGSNIERVQMFGGTKFVMGQTFCGVKIFKGSKFFGSFREYLRSFGV